jgi:hypothetical protein
VQRVEFITVEDEPDLIVSFALVPSGHRSLTLIRSPRYESLLPEEERGVTVSSPGRGEVRDRLVAVDWKLPRVELETEKHRYIVDVSAVANDELADALRVLTKMIRGVALLRKA